jgi:predicted RNase H-like nuclease (RuvC/YqgF family)
MKRQRIMDAICYENYILKTGYNELINHIAKLETEINTLKELNSNNEQVNSIDPLKEINQKLMNEIAEKNKKIAELMKKPVIMLENPSVTSMPLFQISKYCSSVNNLSQMNDKTDTISEITM